MTMMAKVEVEVDLRVNPERLTAEGEHAGVQYHDMVYRCYHEIVYKRRYILVSEGGTGICAGRFWR